MLTVDAYGDLTIKASDPVHTITIHGIKYSIELFRLMATADLGSTFQIVERHDGIVALRRLELKDLGAGDFSFHLDS
jgi:hypothetical protein